MKRISRLARACVLASLLTVPQAGCGDDDDGGGVTPDATAPTPDAGSGPDAAPGDSFEAFVIDLVEHRTADDTAPVPFEDFADLPDTATEESFAPLFP